MKEGNIMANAKRSNDINKKKKCIAFTVSKEEKDRINELAEEQRISCSQYIRQSLELSRNLQVNYPSLSTEIVQLNLLLDKKQENIDKETYKQLKKSISNLTKLLH